MSSRPLSAIALELTPPWKALGVLATWVLGIALLIMTSAAPIAVKILSILVLMLAGGAVLRSQLFGKVSGALIRIAGLPDGTWRLHDNLGRCYPATLLAASRAIRSHALLVWRHPSGHAWALIERCPRNENPLRKVRIRLQFHSESSAAPP